MNGNAGDVDEVWKLVDKSFTMLTRDIGSSPDAHLGMSSNARSLNLRR